MRPPFVDAHLHCWDHAAAHIRNLARAVHGARADLWGRNANRIYRRDLAL